MSEWPRPARHRSLRWRARRANRKWCSCPASQNAGTRRSGDCPGPAAPGLAECKASRRVGYPGSHVPGPTRGSTTPTGPGARVSGFRRPRGPCCEGEWTQRFQDLRAAQRYRYSLPFGLDASTAIAGYGVGARGLQLATYFRSGSPQAVMRPLKSMWEAFEPFMAVVINVVRRCTSSAFSLEKMAPATWYPDQ